MRSLFQNKWRAAPGNSVKGYCSIHLQLMHFQIIPLNEGYYQACSIRNCLVILYMSSLNFNNSFKWLGARSYEVLWIWLWNPWCSELNSLDITYKQVIVGIWNWTEVSVMCIRIGYRWCVFVSMMCIRIGVFFIGPVVNWNTETASILFKFLFRTLRDIY